MIHCNRQSCSGEFLCGCGCRLCLEADAPKKQAVAYFFVICVLWALMALAGGR